MRTSMFTYAICFIYFQIFVHKVSSQELLPIPEAIINGQPLEIYVPFVVGIQKLDTGDPEESEYSQRNWDFLCGGSIIGSRWLVTAAHCLNRRDSPKNYKIFYNTISRFEVNKTVSVKQFFLHEHFNTKTGVNDIALIKVSEPFTLGFTDARRIILNRQEKIIDHTPVTVYGYGKGSFNTLNMMEGRVDSKSDCARRWRQESNFRVEDKQFCIFVGTSDTAPGDSGGPVVIKKGEDLLLAGIVSFGTKATSETSVEPGSKPGVYTDVSYYTDWVQQIVEQNSIDYPNEIFLNKTTTDGTLYKKPMVIGKVEYWDNNSEMKIFNIFGIAILILIGLAVLHFTTIFALFLFKKLW